MTTLADLRLASQERADRVNGPMSTATWNRLVNSTAAELYGALVALYDDYNVQVYSFTLAGGDPGNTLQVGPGTALANFDKLRGLRVNFQGAGKWMPLKRVTLFEKDNYGPPLSAYVYANVAAHYFFSGNTIEVVPAQSAAGSYKLHYIPAYQKLVNDTDSIDGTWMATNGIDEFIVLGTAAKALVIEESLDTANLLLQEQAGVKARLVREFAQRDDNMPGRITDTKGRGGGWGGPGFGVR